MDITSQKSSNNSPISSGSVVLTSSMLDHFTNQLMRSGDTVEIWEDRENVTHFKRSGPSFRTTQFFWSNEKECFFPELVDSWRLNG